jgi:hypothetical protein
MSEPGERVLPQVDLVSWLHVSRFASCKGVLRTIYLCGPGPQLRTLVVGRGLPSASNTDSYP